MKALWIALAMYSRLPAPRTAWEEKNMAWALCWFPAVGLAAAGLLRLWWALCAWLELGGVLFAAVAVIIPAAVSGGIHLDGLCDTCDALGSHQSREKKLEILKDSHAGAFAIIGCGLYLLLLFAAWHQVWPAAGTAGALCLGPLFSRGLSGLMAALLPNARGSGLLARFTRSMDVRRAKAILLLWSAAAAGGMIVLNPWVGLPGLAGAGAVTAYYVVMSRRQFGGITGDLEGFYLQLCELALVICPAIALKIEVLL